MSASAVSGAAVLDWLPLIAIALPLLLAAATALPWAGRLRAALVLSAPVPALLIPLAAPEATLHLPGVLLGSGLRLDALGRPILLAAGLLWLAAGISMRGQLGGCGRALAVLLAMAGSFAAALAGDLVLLLLAATIAGYALYALLAGRPGAPALVLLLVFGDLLLFELVLLLAKTGGALTMQALPATLAAAGDRGMLLALLLLGYGVKAGLIGVHYWLAPALAQAPAASRAGVVAFLLAAGLLPWLRLLAPGELAWPAAGAALAALGLLTLGLAAIAGLLQRRRGALAGYLLSAWSGLWLALLGFGMTGAPGGAPDAGALAALMARGALLIGALLLIGAPAPGRLWLQTVATVLAALLLADTALTAMALVAAPGRVALLGALGAGLGILTGRLLRLTLWRPAAAGSDTAGGDAGPAALMLLAGAAWLALGQSASLSAPLPAAAALLLAALGGLLLEPLVQRLPALPPGDLGPWWGRRLQAAVVLGRGLGRRAAAARGRAQTRLAGLWPGATWRRLARTGEAMLRDWRSAAALFVLLAGLAGALVMAG